MAVGWNTVHPGWQVKVAKRCKDHRNQLQLAPGTDLMSLLWWVAEKNWGKKATEPVHGIKGLPAVQLDGFLKELWFQFLNMLSLSSEPLGLWSIYVVFMLGTVPHTQWHICWVISSPCFERGKTRQSVARPACLPRGLLTHCKFGLRAVRRSHSRDGLLSLLGELLPSFSFLHFSDLFSVFVVSLGHMMALGSSL